MKKAIVILFLLFFAIIIYGHISTQQNRTWYYKYLSNKIASTIIHFAPYSQSLILSQNGNQIETSDTIKSIKFEKYHEDVLITFKEDTVFATLFILGEDKNGEVIGSEPVVSMYFDLKKSDVNYIKGDMGDTISVKISDNETSLIVSKKQYVVIMMDEVNNKGYGMSYVDSKYDFLVMFLDIPILKPVDFEGNFKTFIYTIGMMRKYEIMKKQYIQNTIKEAAPDTIKDKAPRFGLG